MSTSNTSSISSIKFGRKTQWPGSCRQICNIVYALQTLLHFFLKKMEKYYLTNNSRFAIVVYKKMRWKLILQTLLNFCIMCT